MGKVVKKSSKAEVQMVDNVVELVVPIGECLPGYCINHFEFRTTPRQAAAVKYMTSNLMERGERAAGGLTTHPDGKAVERGTEGIRWLLDRLADAIESKTSKSLVTDFDLIFK